MSSLNSMPTARGSAPQSLNGDDPANDLINEEILVSQFSTMQLDRVRDVLIEHGATNTEESRRVAGLDATGEFPELAQVNRSPGLSSFTDSGPNRPQARIITRGQSTGFLSSPYGQPRNSPSDMAMETPSPLPVSVDLRPQVPEPVDFSSDTESHESIIVERQPPVAQQTSESPHLPADFTIGEAQAPLDRHGVGPSMSMSLPSVESVLGQSAGTATLVDSGILEELDTIEPRIILMAGPHRVVTGHTHKIVDVHTQIMFAVAARFYSTLPSSQYDEKTVHFLHYLFTIARGAPERLTAYDAIYEPYQSVTSEGLDHFFTEIAGVLIPDHGPDSSGLLNLLGPGDFNSLLGDLRTSYPEVCVCYNAAYQLVNGGIRCIQPIPNLILNDSTLSRYINLVANGFGRVRSEHVTYDPRPVNLPVVRQRTSVTVPLDDARPVRQSETRPPPHVTGVSSGGIGMTPRAGYPNRPTQLMPQGAPPLIHIERNTTEFRHSVDQMQGIIRRIEVLEQFMRTMETEMAELKEAQRALHETFTSMDQNLAGHLQRYAQGDLQGRSTFNRTVMQTANPEAQSLVTDQPSLTGIPVNRYNDLITRIENVTAETDLNVLTHDIKAVLLAAGETNMANQLIPASLGYEMARKRIVSRLRACNIRI